MSSRPPGARAPPAPHPADGLFVKLIITGAVFLSIAVYVLLSGNVLQGLLISSAGLLAIVYGVQGRAHAASAQELGGVIREMQIGRLAEAERLLDVARPRTALSQRTALLMRGQIALRRGDADTAIRHFDGCVGPPRGVF